MVFAPPEGISVKPAVFTRDISFRMLAVGMMLLFGLKGSVNTLMALFMIFMYIVYVLITLRESRAASSLAAMNSESGIRDTRSASDGSRSSRASISSAVSGRGVGGRASVAIAASFNGVEGALSDFRSQPVDEQLGEPGPERLQRLLGWEKDGGLMDKVNFWLCLPVRPFFMLTMATPVWDPLVNVLMPMAMCIFIPYGNPFGNSYEEFGESTSATIGVIAVLVTGVALTVLIKRTSDQPGNQGKYVSPQFFYWMTFLTSLLWIGMLANEVVGAMQTMGVIMELPSMAMGITMLAWGNCVDNVFATIGLAKAGEFAVAITGIYAAPMFNVLFGNGTSARLANLLTYMDWH
jgi:Ca2+/Na+ antiporter